jgi:hypothetical protein
MFSLPKILCLHHLKCTVISFWIPHSCVESLCTDQSPRMSCTVLWLPVLQELCETILIGWLHSPTSLILPYYFECMKTDFTQKSHFRGKYWTVIFHISCGCSYIVVSHIAWKTIFFWGIGAWTQGLHLEPWATHLFVMGFSRYSLVNYLTVLASNHNLPDLCLLSS